MPRLSPAPNVPRSLPSFSAALSAPAAPLAAPITAEPLAVAAPPSVESPARLANAPLSAAAKATAPVDKAALPDRSLDAFWDGLAIPAQDDEALFAPPSAGADLLPQVAVSPARAGSTASWLSLKNEKYAAALDSAVMLARSTRAGRRALDAARKALDAAGSTLPVDVLGLGRNYGEFDYIEGRLRLDRRLFKPGREAELAGTLAHELLHVAQHAQGLPSNALELEIEAHLQDLELLAELGVKPPPNTFARQLYDALRESPERFIALIELALPGSPFLGGASFEDIEDQLEEELASIQARRGSKAAKLARTIAADLDLIRTPSGRRIYRDFSRRVLTLLKTRAAGVRRSN